MAHVLTGTRSDTAFAPTHLFASLVRQIELVRRASANRQALRYLAELDDVRLNDLGLTRTDVLEAMRSGSGLSSRRADRARAALAR